MVLLIFGTHLCFIDNAFKERNQVCFEIQNIFCCRKIRWLLSYRTYSSMGWYFFMKNYLIGHFEFHLFDYFHQFIFICLIILYNEQLCFNQPFGVGADLNNFIDWFDVDFWNFLIYWLFFLLPLYRFTHSISEFILIFADKILEIHLLWNLIKLASRCIFYYITWKDLIYKEKYMELIDNFYWKNFLYMFSIFYDCRALHRH